MIVRHCGLLLEIVGGLLCYSDCGWFECGGYFRVVVGLGDCVNWGLWMY